MTGRYSGDLTLYGIEKHKKDTLIFDGDNCNSNALEFLLKFKGEKRLIKNKIVEYHLQLHAYNGSEFDTWIILNNLVINKLLKLLKMEKDLLNQKCLMVM